MGIRAVLRRENGDTLRDLPDPAGGTFDAAGDFDGVLPDGDTSFTLLRYVDRYCDTVFNGRRCWTCLQTSTGSRSWSGPQPSVAVGTASA
jgi:hypothetical protein